MQISFICIVMEETLTEQYLRQIRDINLHNRQLLHELVEFRKKEQKSHKWKILGRISLVLMPYILTIALGFFFYARIINTLGSFEAALQEFFPDFPSVQEIKNTKFWESITK